VLCDRAVNALLFQDQHFTFVTGRSQMPDCIVDVAALLVGGALWRRAQDYRARQQDERFRVISHLSQKILKKGFQREWSVTYNAQSRIPLGADRSASAALTEVQTFEDAYLKSQASLASELLAAPSCCTSGPLALLLAAPGGGRSAAPRSLGDLFGGSASQRRSSTAPGGTSSMPEIAVCEELKVWLASIATGAPNLDDVSARLVFYRHLIMRPETFPEGSFLSMLAVVCERLEELKQRVAGTERSCSPQLSKLLDCGRQLTEGILSVLLFSIAEPTISESPLPTDFDGLIASVLLSQGIGQDGLAADSRDALSSYWEKDAGGLLRALLLSKHSLRLQNLEIPAEVAQAAQIGSVLDSWVTLRHRWMDVLDEQGSLGPESGLTDLFWSKKDGDMQQVFLDLHKQLDNMMMFLSMVLYYRRLAGVAGDAGMYHLRSRLHHLLQELEHCCVQVLQYVSKILGEVRRKVIMLLSKEPNPVGRRRLWVERLKEIDESALFRVYRGLLEAIREVRFLSSEARAPQLQANCARSLNQILEITVSPEFRQRCTELPLIPEASIANGLPTLEDGHPSAPSSGGSPVWSAERILRCKVKECHLSESMDTAVLEKQSLADLGDLIRGLNAGDIEAAGKVVVVREASGEEVACLYRLDCEADALAALGLDQVESEDELRDVRSLPAPVSVSSFPEVQAASPTPPTSPPPPRSPPAPAQAPASATPPASSPSRVAAVDSSDSPFSEGRRKVEQSNFYDMLLNAVLLPFFGDDPDGEAVSVRTVRALFLGANLEPPVLETILKVALGGSFSPPEDSLQCIDCKMLQRIGELVSFAQERGCQYESEFLACRGETPMHVPSLRGLSWDGHKLRTLEPLSIGSA